MCHTHTWCTRHAPAAGRTVLKPGWVGPEKHAMLEAPARLVCTQSTRCTSPTNNMPCVVETWPARAPHRGVEELLSAKGSHDPTSQQHCLPPSVARCQSSQSPACHRLTGGPGTGPHPTTPPAPPPPNPPATMHSPFSRHAMLTGPPAAPFVGPALTVCAVSTGTHASVCGWCNCMCCIAGGCRLRCRRLHPCLNSYSK
jgi:hypothetical protein